MNTPESQADQPTQLQPTCRYLRCKEMYYEAADDDAFASGVFWCERTQEPFGPDGEPCSKKQCCANRTCFIS